jgi:glycosyltransferase involved in cell wall biosynthesis
VNIKKIVIDDGNRRVQETGYGALVRELALSLKDHSPFEIYFRPTEETYPETIKWAEELQAIPFLKPHEADLVFRVSSPITPFKYAKPCLFYTQNALGDIPEAWKESLSGVSGLIVPGKFDQKVFSKYFETVYTCPQLVDNTAFAPRERWRSEGAKPFSFLFVGSYSYRKGVDLLPKVFKKAFSDGARVHLHMHCFSGMEGTNITHFFSEFRQLPDNVTVSFYFGHRPIPWMNRYYNRNDAVLTFSRGEGWCMPLHEGLLAGKPVIAPNSTAMGEYLPDAGVEKIKVHEKKIKKIKDSFATPVVTRYSTPNNVLWEIDIDDAARKVRRVYDNHRKYKSAAKEGARFIRETYNRDNTGKRLTEIIRDFEKRQLSGV